MTLLTLDSLSLTIDGVTDSMLYGRAVPTADLEAAARFIASRQGQPGSYRGLFAPTEAEYRDGIRLYTGERVRSGAGTAHILSEEAMRALLILGVETPETVAALGRAREAFAAMMPPAPAGRYCCATCSAALWRHLGAARYSDAESRLVDGLSSLKSRRKDGAWRSFPFHYTVLALLGIDLPEATDELRYCAPAMERALRGRSKDPVLASRRRAVLEKALARC